MLFKKKKREKEYRECWEVGRLGVLTAKVPFEQRLENPEDVSQVDVGGKNCWVGEQQMQS